MSSAESSPLFTTPTSGHEQIPAERLQSGSIRSVMSPLTCVGAMSVTNKLDQLASRAETPSGLRSAPSLMPNGPERMISPLNSAIITATPTRRSLSCSENLGTSSTLENRILTSTSTSPGALIKSGLSRNLTGGLHTLKKCQRRKASSRQSEICTPEGIPEVSDEDLSGSDSASAFPSVVECTSSELCSHNSGLQSSDAGLAPVDNHNLRQDESSAKSGQIIDPVDQAFERARLTQEQPPKVLQSQAMARRPKTPGLRVEFANPPVAFSATETNIKTPRSSGQGDSGLGSRPSLHGLSSCSGPSTVMSNIGDVSGTSMPLARAVIAESFTTENTRGLWCPPWPRTPAMKRGIM